MVETFGRWVEDEVKGLAWDFSLLQTQQMPENINHENWAKEVDSCNKRLSVMFSYLRLIQVFFYPPPQSLNFTVPYNVIEQWIFLKNEDDN